MQAGHERSRILMEMLDLDLLLTHESADHELYQIMVDNLSFELDMVYLYIKLKPSAENGVFTNIFASYLPRSSNVNMFVNLCTPMWMGGNIAHGITMLVLAPSLLAHDIMDKSQQRDAIFNLYKLVVIHKLDLGARDSCNQTPIELFQSCCEECVINADVETVKLLEQVLCKSESLRVRQQFLVKRFLMFKKMRRARAAKIITTRALEYILNPDTAVGRRLLAGRAASWYDKCKSL